MKLLWLNNIETATCQLVTFQGWNSRMSDIDAMAIMCQTSVDFHFARTNEKTRTTIDARRTRMRTRAIERVVIFLCFAVQTETIGGGARC